MNNTTTHAAQKNYEMGYREARQGRAFEPEAADKFPGYGRGWRDGNGGNATDRMPKHAKNPLKY